MNENHAVCGTPEWAEQLQREILTPLLGDVDLGDRLLEVGPGPGGATDWLRHRVRELVAVEIEPEAAEALERRFVDSNVTVVPADAAALPYPAESFDSAATFTMLHHVPTRAAQHALLSEMVRVLRPGGRLAGSDSIASDAMRAGHEADVYNPLPPGELLTCLHELGCCPITVTVAERFTFLATKPHATPADEAR